MLKMLPCLDTAQMSASRKQELDIPRNIAASLGRSAVDAATRGYYHCGAGTRVDWSSYVEDACSEKVSLPVK